MPPRLPAAVLLGFLFAAAPADARRACEDDGSCGDEDVESALMQKGRSQTTTSFFVVQMADPQFGLENYGTLDWKQEQAMLNLSILEINRLRPKFVVNVGDLQNWYPTNVGGENGPLANATGAGEMQVAAVKQSLALLDPSIPLRAIVPGNHDVGDAPKEATLAKYEERWGASRGSFVEEGILFLYFNSQLYFNASQPGMQKAANEQTEWLAGQLKEAGDQGAAGVVLLVHIPPFIGHADEQTGWANWPKAARDTVLGMTQGMPVSPRVVVCGHFHGNVERVDSDAFGAHLEVVTTSSVGAPMRWNGSQTGLFTPAQASAIGTLPSGSDAFNEYIVRNGGSEGPANFTLRDQRIQAKPSRSGVRIFEFHSARGYRHRWFTLEALGDLQRLDGSTLADETFTPFHSR